MTMLIQPIVQRCENVFVFAGKVCFFTWKQNHRKSNVNLIFSDSNVKFAVMFLMSTLYLQSNLRMTTLAFTLQPLLQILFWLQKMYFLK